MTTKTAIILFNLGGPDSLDAVQPFLFNLFSDKAILRVPQPLRYLLAKLISTRRAPIAREIYKKIDGASPLLPLTLQQANELERELKDDDITYQCFVCMRYWHPMTHDVVADVKAWNPDHILLLPLYPQYSTTTTGSSLELWHKEAARRKLDTPTRTLCCYPTQPEFIAAHTSLIQQHLHGLSHSPRLLFSAHGLPEKIIAAGDPYQWQVEQTARTVMQQLNRPDLEWTVCYQSKVGPLKWIGPSTEEEILRAGRDKTPIMIIPIAFVSEHSETLVELDIEYKHLAEAHGVPAYTRVPALGSHQAFSESLAVMVRAMTRRPPGTLAPDTGARLCPPGITQCQCVS